MEKFKNCPIKCPHPQLGSIYYDPITEEIEDQKHLDNTTIY